MIDSVMVKIALFLDYAVMLFASNPGIMLFFVLVAVVLAASIVGSRVQWTFKFEVSNNQGLGPAAAEQAPAIYKGTQRATRTKQRTPRTKRRTPRTKRRTPRTKRRMPRTRRRTPRTKRRTSRTRRRTPRTRRKDVENQAKDVENQDISHK